MGNDSFIETKPNWLIVWYYVMIMSYSVNYSKGRSREEEGVNYFLPVPVVHSVS